MDGRIEVVFIFRKKFPYGNFSIENVFESVINGLSKKIKVFKYYQRYHTFGIFKRLMNAIFTIFNQRRINHITGDIHYVSLFLRKRNTVLTIHDCVMLRRTNGVKRKILKLIWYKIPYYRVAKITTVSEQIKSELISMCGYSPDKIEVIPNPVSSLYQKKIKNILNFPPIILVIGTTENKNISRLAQAIVDINCTLVIVGKISDYDKNILIKNKILYENYYNLTNQEIYEQYLRCDILSFVSTYEGFGMPIIEAQSVGRAVLTSNISPMKEVSGGAAMLVDPYSIDDIRIGITKIIDDNLFREKIIIKGLINCKNYSSEYISKKYEDIYRQLVYK